MSQDMFVFTLPEGESRFPREIVERAFAPFVEDVKEDYWQLHLDGERTWVNMSVEQAETISVFSINRPPGYEGFPGFWDALYDVLQQTCTGCILAGGKADPDCCVGNTQALECVPPDLVGPIGRGRLVSSGAELEDAV